MPGPNLASAASGGSSPQPFDLTVLANVKGYLSSGGQTIGSTDDALLQRMISSLSQSAQQYMGYDVTQGNMLAATAYSELRDSITDQAGWPNQWLFGIPVRWTPIQSVASVTMDGIVIPSGGDPISKTGYFFDSSDPIQIWVAGYWPISRGKKNIAVSYTGGYPLIPYDVEQACIETIALRYKELQRIGVRSLAMAGESTTFIIAELPPSAQALFNRYRRIVVG